MRASIDSKVDDLLSACENDRRLLRSTRSCRDVSLRLRVSSGQLVLVAPGLFARPSTWEALKPHERHLWLARTLAERDPRVRFCGVTAAVIRDLPVSWSLLDQVHMASRHNQDAHGTSLVRKHRMGGDLWETVDGLKVTSPERTAFDCLRSMGFRDGLVIADAMVASGMSVDDLLGFMDGVRRRGFHGTHQARLTASYANGLAESGGESKARAAMIELGYAIPQLQKTFVDPIDGSTRRVDFFWERDDGTNVIGELDGRDKYVDPSMTRGRSSVDVLADERLRESHLSLAGSPILRFSVADTYNSEYFSGLLDAFGVPHAVS